MGKSLPPTSIPNGSLRVLWWRLVPVPCPVSGAVVEVSRPGAVPRRRTASLQASEWQGTGARMGLRLNFMNCLYVVQAHVRFWKFERQHKTHPWSFVEFLCWQQAKCWVSTNCEISPQKLHERRTLTTFYISPELGVGIPGHCAGRWKGAGAQSDPWKIRKLPWGISAEDRHWRLAKPKELVMTTWRKKTCGFSNVGSTQT